MSEWKDNNRIQYYLSKARSLEPSYRQTENYIALMLAVSEADIDVVRTFLRSGVGPDPHQSGGRSTALMEAMMADRTKIAELLLDEGANPNTSTTTGISPLSLAACHGHVDCVKLLLKKGAATDQKTDEGRTALIWAALKGHTQIVQELVKAGADTAPLDEKDRSALMWASLNGHADVVNALLEAGADANQKSTQGTTALRLAAVRGHRACHRSIGRSVPRDGRYGNVQHGCDRSPNAGGARRWSGCGADRRPLLQPPLP